MRALCLLILSGCAGAQQYVISTIAGGAAPPSPVTATQASIGDPARVICDSAGNVYFTSLHSVFKVDPGGVLTRVAGNGRAGNSGDQGLATSAQLSDPMGMALDGGGNLYVADRDANVVRRIAGGVITTVAAGLHRPFDVAIDPRGGIYVADTGNDRVVRVGADGSLADIAGGGAFNRPEGLAFDSAGNLYIADTFNGRIRRFSSDGRLTTIAGTGATGIFSGDGGPAVNAALSLPTAVAVDSQDNLYVADFGNGRVRKISGGMIDTVLGSSIGVPVIDGEPAFSARLIGPTGVAIDRNGAIYFAEGGIGSGSGLARGDYRVWKVPPSGELRTLAGTGVPSFAGDGGPLTAAQFHSPSAAAFDGIGNLFIADTANHRIRRVDTDGNLATLLGDGTPGFAVDFGNPSGAHLNSPHGLVADASGGIYFADTGNNRVRRYQPGGNLFTYAGNGNAAYFGDGGRATSASLNQPEGLALDAAGNLYIADSLDNAVRKVTPAGVITTIAGTGLTGFAGDGGPATRAQLNRPRAVAVDTLGNVYVADSGNHRVRIIEAGGNIHTIAGNGGTEFFPGDSEGTSVSLSDPRGVAVDSAGNVYIADTGHNRIRKLFPSGAITTIAGYDGTCCYSGDNGLAVTARLNAPTGLMLGSGGSLYIADSGNGAIRVLRPIATSVSVAAVTNAASNLTGPVAPGELVTLYGPGLDSVRRITFNGLSAAVLYATTNQAGAMVPPGLSGSSAQLIVETASTVSAPFAVQVAPVAPGIFTADASGKGQALAVNQDGARNGRDHSTGAGETLTLYVTGEGQGNPISVTIGGAPATVQYAGPVTPLAVPGVLQVTVIVPDRVFGTLPVIVSAARVPTQDGVTLVVR
jgi:trimeric autotransporter adhesin